MSWNGKGSWEWEILGAKQGLPAQTWGCFSNQQPHPHVWGDSSMGRVSLGQLVFSRAAWKGWEC